jgi:vesicle transport through interaction with t-SNAREs 1
MIKINSQVAIETEATGTEILSELDSQRESLLRTSERLENANTGLRESGKITRLMSRAVLYNKLVLILIIALEAFILGGLVYLKFIK